MYAFLTNALPASFFQMLTPSGRFICGEDICLSASNYHPETWTPRWTVISLVDALRLHMLTTANEIGGLLSTDEKRRQYALESRSWRCPGVANHRRMVEEGIFPLRQEVEDESVDPIAVANDDSRVELQDTSTEGNGEQQHSMVDSESNDSTSPDSLPINKQSQSAKRVKNTDDSQTKHAGGHTAMTKSAKADPKYAKARKVANMMAGIKSQSDDARVIQTPANLEEQPGMVLVILKLFIVEVLKLPLRALSILLRVLSRVESTLRSILDSV